MNLHALRLFHVIATTGSVTRAAELLNISQPAITAQVKKFEKELSLTLFKPQGRGIGLTQAGAELLPLAKGSSRLSSRSNNSAGITAAVRGGISDWPQPTFPPIFFCRPGSQNTSSGTKTSK